MWEVSTAKVFCEIQKQCNRKENHFTPAEGVFPFDDFLIKV
jgi:hypothetical protein